MSLGSSLLLAKGPGRAMWASQLLRKDDFGEDARPAGSANNLADNGPGASRLQSPRPLGLTCLHEADFEVQGRPSAHGSSLWSPRAPAAAQGRHASAAGVPPNVVARQGCKRRQVDPPACGAADNVQADAAEPGRLSIAAR